MPITKTTLVELPHNVSDINGTLNDGVSYQSIGGTFDESHFLATSTDNPIIVVSETPMGAFYDNFFNSSQIPSYATIKGVEVVATSVTYNGNLRHSSIRSSANSFGSFEVKCYLHNGISYSSALIWDTHPDISLSDDSRTAEFDGSSKKYKNESAGDDVLFGGPNDLSGLTWDPSNQSGFGLALTFINEIDDPVMIFSRGIGLRVTYDVPVTPKIIINTGTKAKLTPKTTTITETRTATAQTTAGTAFVLADVLLGTSTVDFPVPPANYASLGINRTTGDNIELNDFGFNIPSNATIDSLKLIYNLDRNDTSGNDDDFKLRFFLEQNITAQTFPFVTPTHNSNTNFATQEISITNSTILQPNFINNIAWIINWPTDSAYWDNDSTGAISLSGYNSRPAGDLSGTALTESILEKPRIQVTYSTSVEGKFKLTEVP